MGRKELTDEEIGRMSHMRWLMLPITGVFLIAYILLSVLWVLGIWALWGASHALRRSRITEARAVIIVKLMGELFDDTDDETYRYLMSRQED